MVGRVMWSDVRVKGVSLAALLTGIVRELASSENSLPVN